MTITEFCQRAIGVPFKPDGEDFSGWDCWGLLRSFYRLCLGVVLTDYRQRPLLDSFETEMARWQEIDPGQARPGDGVLMRGEPFHVAVVIARTRMLHVTRGADTTLEDFTSVRWGHRVVGIYRRGAG
ncbi:MAG: NlpC/P60 family protein [Candidatus Thermoplasmatota archaeon]|nr:NlpC/P60 family protein [Candidatus Thermoplasmatota archaeon]